MKTRSKKISRFPKKPEIMITGEDGLRKRKVRILVENSNVHIIKWLEFINNDG